MTHILRAGERLELDQSLVSANGRFRLLLQRDSNLVLYHDAIDVGNAYWASGTNWLPEGQRPIRLDMQGDAHLVLYDAAGAARWGSGTWGPGFVDPRLVLQDDGNLIIYHDGGSPVWASGDVGGAGQIRPAGLVPAPMDIDFAVESCGRMPVVVSGSTDLAAPTVTTVDAGGVAYHVTEQRRRLVNDVVEHAFLQDIARMGVWPGQVIQGNSLLSGDVAPIGPLPRRPGTVEVVTDVTSGTPGGQSAKVTDPDSATVNQARRDIIRGLTPTDSPGPNRPEIKTASTLREVGARLGISVKGSAFGVDANAALNQTHKQLTVVASIRQVFYSVTFTTDSRGAAGLWPEDRVRHGDLQPYMGAGNPPLLVDSVQYGRFICVTAQGAFSSSEIAAALRAHLNAAVSAGVEVDLRTKEVLESSEIQIYTLGVPGSSNFQSISNPIGELDQVYRSGLRFTPQNLGAPISFTCRHIADNTLAHVGLAAEYSQPLSVQGENITDRQFHVYDGPSGGLVDTRISVNPGDQVTIHAEGQIDSGVFASRPHEADGWRGHTADRAAPLPQGTAYCLVAGFRDHQWFEAGRFWQGSPEPGAPGRLRLNINDNNPYNGDPRYRWTVHVDVARAGAAAAGIYI